MELRILDKHVNILLFMPFTGCVKTIETTVKIFNMNRMKDFNSSFKPVACVLHFAWKNQNLALPIEDLEARASTLTLLLYFLACSPCTSLADSFFATTLHSPPPISTAGIAYIMNTYLSLCASCLHPLELYSTLHHNYMGPYTP
jgi:hypothetical protein